MVNRSMKAVSLIVMVCVVLVYACTGYAREAIIYDGFGAASHEVVEAPQLHVEYVEQVQAPQMEYVVQDNPAADQPAQGNAAERWYRVTYYDLDGAEIMYYTLREGERVDGPGFVPYRQDLDFQYWYDYDQAGGPVPFQFGGAATRDLNLVPYYHYPPTAPDMTYVVYDDGRTVADMAQGIIESFVSQEVNASDVDVVQIQEVMSEEDSQQLVAGILMDSVRENIDNTVGHTSVISEEATDRLITGILLEVVQENMGSTFEAPSAFSPEETDLLVMGILSEDAAEEIATAEPVSGTVAPEEEAELLIGEILAGGNGTAWQDVPETGTAINEEEASQIIAEILVESGTVEEAAAEADGETNTVMQLGEADEIIAKLLAEHANAGLPEEADLPEQDVDAGEVTIETWETQVEEESGVLIPGVFWEELLSGGSTENVETKITTAMSDEHVEATIANIISGSVMVSAISTPPDETAGDVVIHAEESMGDTTVVVPEENAMPDAQADGFISDMLSQEPDEVPQDEADVITIDPEDDEVTVDEPFTDAQDTLIFAEDVPSDDADLLVAQEPDTEEPGDEEVGMPPDDMQDQEVEAQALLQEEAFLPEYDAAPWVEVQYSADGEIVPGSLVTLTATVHNVDPGLQLHYQWENNASGSFQSVPTAVGRVHTFVADESNTACEWRVSIAGE